MRLTHSLKRDRADNLPGKLLKRSFFQASPEHVAPRLLGMVLARRTRSGWLGGRIVEVEAYLGPHNTTPDPAAHSHRGPTPRNLALFGPPGHAYVYFIYGRYYCMNFSCEKEGLGGGILLRALEPLVGIEQMARRRGLPPDAAHCELTGGPGRLCQAMGITRPLHNGLDLLDSASILQVRDDGFRLSRVLATRAHRHPPCRGAAVALLAARARLRLRAQKDVRHKYLSACARASVRAARFRLLP